MGARRHVIRQSAKLELLVLLGFLTVIALLAAVAVPAFSGARQRADQVAALTNARQIYLGLAMYAADHGGTFPQSDAVLPGLPEQWNTSNGVLQILIPDYVSLKEVFAVPGSAYCTAALAHPDGPAPSLLRAGENEWAYVSGLTDSATGEFPLLASGFANIHAEYVEDPRRPGGVWRGKNAIIVRVDGTASVERCQPQGEIRGVRSFYVPRSAADETNLFEATPGWLDQPGIYILLPLAQEAVSQSTLGY